MMGTFANMSAASANYTTQAAAARANARVARAQAQANAYKLEADASAQGAIAGDNMMTMRRNQALQMAAVRNQQGGSGFAASSGSKLSVESSVAEVFEKAIADQMRSNAIADQNARAQANALRRSGETQFNLGMVQANALSSLASASSQAAPWMLLGEGLTWGGNQLITFAPLFSSNQNTTRK